jgi:putative radical SAM enzyme (TIGR03279 family)
MRYTDWLMLLAPTTPPELLHPALIKRVEADSMAGRAGVRAGDSLIRVNGNAITDILAYRRELENGAKAGGATLEVRQTNGLENLHFTVEWEDPGLEFEEVLFDGIKICANKCEFCYVHQMPQGFRKSLYVMDDDFRLSFLYGSFVTLTNLSEEDFDRILSENLSPLYVSVHTTDQALRADMMKWWRLKVKDPESTKIQDALARLESIDLYTQLVLLPNRNDGEHFEETLEYLTGLPNVQSVACVPVGLTGHRRNLPDLRPYNASEARAVLEIAHRWQRKMLEERGTRFIFPSDEFYLLAGHPLPPEEAYEGFPMLENGVGMVRDFLSDGFSSEGLPPLPKAVPATKVIIGTGPLFAPVLELALEPLRAVRGLDVEVRVIPNISFGEPTTVAGLLTGRCFLAGVKPGEADLLMVSPSTLRYGTEIMLDEITLTDLRERLKMDVQAGGKNLCELVGAILERTNLKHAGLEHGGHEMNRLNLPQFGQSAHAIKDNS